MLQMDAGRGIIWLNDRRILEKIGAAFKWTDHDFIDGTMDLLKEELPRRVAAARS